MRLIIDIPEGPLYRDMYTAICENGYIFDEDNECIAKAIKSGISIPDNATNGDMIKAIFPNGKVIERDEATGYEQMLDDKYSYCSWFDGLWWNSPYQKGGK